MHFASFDAPTMLALTAAIAITAGALIIFSWLQAARAEDTPGPGARLRERPNVYLALWGASDILGGIAVVLLLQRGVVANFLSIVVANAILLLAYGLMWSATRAFGGSRTPVGWIAGGALLWLAACAVPPFLASQTLRIVLTSAVVAAYTTLGGARLWRGRRERLASLPPAAVCLFVHAAFCACRVPLAFRDGVHASHLIGSPWFTLFLFETLIHVIAMAILVVSMAKERAECVQRTAASTDELTGAASRRAFLAEGEARLSAAHKRGVAASLLLLDLDHFKGINDTCGHEAGDQALRAFAVCAMRTLSPADLFGRIGGEEFAALVIGAGSATVMALAERMRRAVEQIELSDRAEPLRLSVSIGVATAFEPAIRLDAMMGEADRALYRAKSAGRNRVESSVSLAA